MGGKRFFCSVHRTEIPYQSSPQVLAGHPTHVRTQARGRLGQRREWGRVLDSFESMADSFQSINQYYREEGGLTTTTSDDPSRHLFYFKLSQFVFKP